MLIFYNRNAQNSHFLNPYLSRTALLEVCANLRSVLMASATFWNVFASSLSPSSKNPANNQANCKHTARLKYFYLNITTSKKEEYFFLNSIHVTKVSYLLYFKWLICCPTCSLPTTPQSALERNFSASATSLSSLDVGPALVCMYLMMPSEMIQIKHLTKCGQDICEEL